MTSSSFDGGDWEVLDLDVNPTPGDPDAISSLASGLLNEAQLAQQRAARLQSVADSSSDLAMQGDYAQQFQRVLSSLPGPPGDLADSCQSSATALSAFADALADAQAQSSAALQQGMQADAAYQSALGEFCSVVPLEFSGTGVWRGLNEATATELAGPMADETENPELLDWAAQIGQYAGSAEDDRQAAIRMAVDAAQQRSQAEEQCAQLIQDATPQPLPAGTAGDAALPAVSGAVRIPRGQGAPGDPGGSGAGWPKLPTTPLDADFAGEDKPGNSVWSGGRVVRYLNDAQRAERQIFIRDGKLYDASGRLFDTTQSSTSYTEGRAIWAMDEDGNLYASTEQETGQFHHSSFLGGGSVAGAGEIEVQDGEVTFINDRAGHYDPPRAYTRRVIARLRALGVSIPPGERSHLAPNGGEGIEWWAPDDGSGDD
jgi:hypothetical protein